jgi:hypothetical protein
MQYASGENTAFGLNPRVFDMLAQLHSEKVASKPLSKNQRKRLNKKKRAEQEEF